MGRTGAREMFLATLDTSISNEVLETLYEANIQITTTQNIKNQFYPNNHRVLSFEKLIEICMHTKEQWNDYTYNSVDIEQITQTIQKQIFKHENHTFVKNFYQETAKNFTKEIECFLIESQKSDCKKQKDSIK